MHEIVLNNLALVPEDGLIIGNGDISVSVYQVADEIRFRFGKGDVWDRRLRLHDNPRPAHIKEVADGILKEGWKCAPWGGDVQATRGSADNKRMREICQGSPPSYINYPFPCPKPLAELSLHLPGDLMNMNISQRLIIEDGRLEIVCEWRGNVKLKVECIVHPTINRLALRWSLDGWTAENRTGGWFYGLPQPFPVFFSLYREADQDIESFGRQHYRSCRHELFLSYSREKVQPLPRPDIVEVDGVPVLQQRFPDDSLFKGGFNFAVAGYGPKLNATANGHEKKEVMHFLPDEANQSTKHAGELSIAVATTADSSGEESEAQRAVGLAKESSFDIDCAAAENAAKAFWSKSEVCLSEPFLDQLWHSTMHVKRCVLKEGKTPPGLFLPSTIRDFSLWHGDFHSNYNFQSIFLGDYGANHQELGDAYFDGIEYFLRIGKKIARDYYGCRGTFVQLSAFPTHPEDDPLGCVPMGRMAYMTGWVAAYYLLRWRYSLDRDWLSAKGYPTVKDLALFYTDFLQKKQDGYYHAFPSNQGEDGFNGEAQPYTDRAQVIRHARYCLQCASEMASVLKADSELVSKWDDIIEHLAPEDGDSARQSEVFSKEIFKLLPPEFLGFDGEMPPRDVNKAPAFLFPGHVMYDWYPGKLPYEWSIHLRNGAWSSARDFAPMVALLKRWVHANGLLWAMSIANYGHVGGWTETLGITGPIQDMLLQSWTGTIEFFPGWPLDYDASFKNLRAEGAFLVSANVENGIIGNITVVSERGGECRVCNPWGDKKASVWVQGGERQVQLAMEDNVICFGTRPGSVYVLISE